MRFSARFHETSRTGAGSAAGPIIWFWQVFGVKMAFNDSNADNVTHDRFRLIGTDRRLFPPSLYRRGGKRVFDIGLILLALPVVLPFILFLILVLALSGERPLYSQQRIGRDGRSFRLWKLRTMVPDADARLEACLQQDPAARLEWDRNQKLKEDPRVTRMGQVLRKTSLDELPQLWNVMKGDMSLIGPRPMMPCQRSIYPGEAYYHMRPGITGPWQVSARNDSSFADRAQFDSGYLRDMSLGNDMRLLVATAGVVIRRTGH